MIKAGNLYVSLWTFVLVLFAALCGALRWLLLSYAVLGIHELAHYFTAKRLKITCRGLWVQPFGITIRLCDNLITEPSCEILLCAAGPAVNLCIAAGMYFACDLQNADAQYFFISNLSIAAINLLPILPLDGGRILKAYLTARLGLVRAIQISEIVTWFFVLGVGLCSILALWTMRFNVSLMILVAFLLFNMSTEKNNNRYLVMRQLAAYKQKLSKQKVVRVRNLAAQTDTPARQVAAHFSYDKFHVVHLFDERQNHVASLTETQVLDGLVQQGSAALLGALAQHRKYGEKQKVLA